MLSEGIISKTLSINPVLLKHFKDNRDLTNSVIFGDHVNTAIGLASSATIAKNLGTVTPLQVLINFAKRGSLGIANMSATGTVASAGVNMLGNGIIIYVGLKGGILIGSGINAAIQTYIQHE